MPLIPPGKRKLVKPRGKDRLGTERSISTSRFDLRQEVKTLETVEKDDEYRQRVQIFLEEYARNGDTCHCVCLVEAAKLNMITSDKPSNIKIGSPPSFSIKL